MATMTNSDAQHVSLEDGFSFSNVLKASESFSKLLRLFSQPSLLDTGAREYSARPFVRGRAETQHILISEAPRHGPLPLAPVSAKELKERAFQGVL
jgi:hypothetical protein